MGESVGEAVLAGKVAIVTGGSRGVGAATVLALARAGADVAVNYRNKGRRAEDIASQARRHGVRAIAIQADITDSTANQAMIDQVISELGRIDILVLNASGGMEKDLVVADPAYPMKVNRDAPYDLATRALPRMRAGGAIVHVTSHLAHFYGQVKQPPAYEPVAQSKHAGEIALRSLERPMSDRGVRLAIVSGDLIEDTIVPRLMDRATPGLIEMRRSEVGTLPTTADMAHAILDAIAQPVTQSPHVVFIGSTELTPLKANATRR
ncbi:MAG: SDR family NAD(P)-dependent oxidoreductase [Chloroflexota bacterium]|nr:MAG: SDR family NAD(P)-dependent oxidoreductase [Chloroflexota bacterium]